MRRLLEIELNDYWRQFEEGHIGRQAAFVLSRSVEHALDNIPVITPRHSLEESFKVPPITKMDSGASYYGKFDGRMALYTALSQL